MSFVRFGGNIRDDAGKRVKLLDPAGISEWPSRGTDPRIDLLVTRIRRAMSTQSWRDWVLPLAVAAVVLAAFKSLQSLLNQAFPGMPAVLHILIVFALVHLAAYPLWRSRLSANRGRVTDLILEDGLCPCCGYNFAGLGLRDVDPGTLVVCPECGSSWQRNRIDRLEEFPRDAAVGSPLRQVRKPLKAPSWSTRDDRGRTIPLAHPRLRVAYADATSTAQRERLRRLRRDLARPRDWIRFIAAALLVVCAVGVFVLVIGGAVSSFTGLILMVLFIAGAAGALLSNFAFDSRDVRSTLLADGLCPSCVTDLSGIEASPRDACTVCPVCHSAWMLADESTPATSKT